MKGYEWVGWKRNSERNLIHKLLNNTQIRSINTSIDTQSLPYVPLAFKFDYIRNKNKYSHFQIHVLILKSYKTIMII